MSWRLRVRPTFTWNLEKMMANQKAATEECVRVFGVEKAENFTSLLSELFR